MWLGENNRYDIFVKSNYQEDANIIQSFGSLSIRAVRRGLSQLMSPTSPRLSALPGGLNVSQFTSLSSPLINGFEVSCSPQTSHPYTSVLHLSSFK